MPVEKGETREFNLRQVLPWTELFRAFSIALDPSKLLLATAAVVLMWFGWWLLSLIFQEQNTFGQWPANAQRGANPYVVLKDRPGSLFTTDFWLGSTATTDATKSDAPPVDLPAAESGLANAKPPVISAVTDPGRRGQPPVHLEPFHKFMKPILGLFDSTPGRLDWWYLLLGLLMTVAVWGIFGGAITRIAAVQFARNEKIGMGEALRFSASKFVHFASAPLIPFGVMAVIAIIMFLGGLLLNIPWLGDVLASLLWVLPLLGALAMAIALLGYIGWPLMYATISVEGSDNFTALSNSYIYVFSRPLHYLWYMTVAVVFGMVVTFFVVFFTSMTVYLSQWGVGLSSAANWRDPDPVRALFIYAPSSYEWDRLLVVPPDKRAEIVTPQQFAAYRDGIRKNMDFVPVVSAGIMAFWLHLIFLVMIAFAYSFFWSASTIIYFLLRKKVDDTEMDEVYMDEEDDMPLPPPTTMAPASPATLPMVDAPRPAPEPPKTDGGAPRATMPGDGNAPPA